MKRFFGIALGILLCATLTHVTHAETDVAGLNPFLTDVTAEDIDIEQTPDFPSAFENVTIRLSSNATDLNRYRISWTVNGAATKSGIGERVLSVKTGAFGEAVVISATIALPAGPVTKVIRLVPEDATILWEAIDSTVPPFYKGKKLPAPEAIVKLTAIPNFRSEGGRSTSSDNAVYIWKRNGSIIAEAVEKVGSSGVVTVEESQGMELSYDIVEGLQLDKGYVSAYMVTNPERMEAEMKDAVILVTDKKIGSVQEILPLLEKVVQSGKKDLVIIADDVEGDALSTFIVNKLRGTFNVLAVKAPGFGDRKKDILADIATVVGGQVISNEVGMTFENATLAMLGKASRVVATKDTTTIVGGKGKKTDITARITQLTAQKENSDSKFDKEKLEERIAKLSGGVAVISVGAATETEMKYLKDKIDDAVKATKASIDEGIVSGGGTALAKVAKKLAGTDIKMTTDERVGFDIVVRALEMPLAQIAINAGKDDSALIVSKVQSGKINAGYNALTDEMVEDMLSAGIVDPVKMPRMALENAVSAAAILLTTEAAIADIPEPKTPSAGGDMGGMGY
jgi:chaperonin GroEL